VYPDQSADIAAAIRLDEASSQADRMSAGVRQPVQHAHQGGTTFVAAAAGAGGL